MASSLPADSLRKRARFQRQFPAIGP